MENAPTSNHQMGLEKNEKLVTAGMPPTSAKSYHHNQSRSELRQDTADPPDD